MLIEFRVSNYRSICEEQIISLVPAPKQKDYLDNILVKGKNEGLNAIALYGANASGKSNLLAAMGILSKMVQLSARTSSTASLPYDPFLLKESYSKMPTEFEITFIVDENRYRYGLSFYKDEVVTEWLFRKNIGREVVLFQREGDIIDVSSGFNGNKKVIDTAIVATRPNALFLSSCDMFNIEEAKQIFSWFRHFVKIDGLNTQFEEFQTIALFQHAEYKDKIENYIYNLDLHIAKVSVEISKIEEPRSGESPSLTNGERYAYKLLSTHKLYNENGTPSKAMYTWDYNDKESEGAKKAFQLSGPVLWALANGGTLIIDEIEAKMHPIMTLSTIDIFLNPISNPNKAQLIFATHDTNLLSYSKLRRDQICLVEKNNWEATAIFSLSDYVYIGEKNGVPISEKERPDTDKEKRYLEGRYRAIPMLGNFKKFITSMKWQGLEK